MQCSNGDTNAYVATMAWRVAPTASNGARIMAPSSMMLNIYWARYPVLFVMHGHARLAAVPYPEGSSGMDSQKSGVLVGRPNRMRCAWDQRASPLTAPSLALHRRHVSWFTFRT